MVVIQLRNESFLRNFPVFSIEEVRCSNNHKKMSSQLHQEYSACKKPRKQLVSLRMPTKYYMPGIQYFPDKYEVERCDGVCQQQNHKCLPIEKEMIDVPVTRSAVSILAHLTLQGGRQSTNKCMIVKIEKHLRCHCQCAMTDQMCVPGKQVFSSHNCACECLDTSRTCADKNRMWSKEKCDCVCPTISRRDCSSGAMFDEENCRCVETMS